MIMITGSSGTVGKMLLTNVPMFEDVIKYDISDDPANDILDTTRVRDTVVTNGVNCIINLAERSTVPEVQLPRNRYYEVNDLGVASICNAVDGLPCRVIHVSTGYLDYDYTKNDKYVDVKRDGEVELFRMRGVNGVVLRVNEVLGLDSDTYTVGTKTLLDHLLRAHAGLLENTTIPFRADARERYTLKETLVEALHHLRLIDFNITGVYSDMEYISVTNADFARLFMGVFGDTSIEFTDLPTKRFDGSGDQNLEKLYNFLIELSNKELVFE